MAVHLPMGTTELKLKELGFEGLSGNSAKRRALFNDWYVEIKPSDTKWQHLRPDGEVYVYLKAPRFGRFMQQLFHESRFQYASYRPQRLTNDSSGTLGMALMSVKMRGEALGFFSAALFLDFKYLGVELARMCNPYGVWRALYENDFGGALDLVEDVWVYLFLSYETDLDDEVILAQLDEVSFLPEVRRWRLRKPMDADLVSAARRDFQACLQRG